MGSEEEADRRCKLVVAALTSILAGSVMLGAGQASSGSEERDPSRSSIGLWGDVPYDARQRAGSVRSPRT